MYIVYTKQSNGPTPKGNIPMITIKTVYKFKKLAERYDKALDKICSAVQTANLHIDAHVSEDFADIFRQALPEALNCRHLLLNTSLKEVVYYLEGIANNQTDLMILADKILDYAICKYEGIRRFVTDPNAIDLKKVIADTSNRFRQYIDFEMTKSSYYFNGGIDEDAILKRIGLSTDKE
jgi:hypothetical protein